MFDIIFNICLLDQNFKSKLVLELTMNGECLFEKIVDIKYIKLKENNAKLRINKNKIIIEKKKEKKYIDLKNTILALKCISDNQSIILRSIINRINLFYFIKLIDDHFKNEKVVSLLKSFPLIKRIVFYHLTENHSTTPFDIKMNLKEIEIIGIFNYLFIFYFRFIQII